MSRIKSFSSRPARDALPGIHTARCIAWCGEGPVFWRPWLRRLGLWRLWIRIPRLRFWRLRYVALYVWLRLRIWIPSLWNGLRRNGLRRNGLRRNGLRRNGLWRNGLRLSRFGGFLSAYGYGYGYGYPYPNITAANVLGYSPGLPYAGPAMSSPYTNPLFGLGLTPLGVQSYVAESNMLGRGQARGRQAHQGQGVAALRAIRPGFDVSPGQAIQRFSLRD